MSAGTNWKRPWEDEHEQHSARRASGPATTPGFVPSYSYPTPTSAVQSQGERKLPPMLSTAGISARSVAPERVYHRPYESDPLSRSQSPSHARKRPRLQYESNAERFIQRRPSEPLLTHFGAARPSGIDPLDHRQPQYYNALRTNWSPASLGREVEDLRIHTSDTKSARGISEPVPPISSSKCSMCSNININEHIQGLISGLMRLNTDLCRGLKSDTAGCTLQGIDVAQVGVKSSFDWLLSSVNLNIGIAREIVVRGPLTKPFQSVPHTASVPVEVGTKRKTERQDLEREHGVQRPSSGSSEEVHTPDATNLPMMGFGTEGRRKSYVGDPPPLMTQSPRGTVSSSGSIIAQSPMQAPPSTTRMLPSPSPSSLNFGGTLPPVSPSSAPSTSAHMAHFQDLQHQVSTKTLALQTLQREHDNLLSAFSRNQTRFAALDKKFQVSDAEINALTEEKIRLQASVEALEQQVEELVKSRDEASKQSVASRGQYMKIMEMASRLEAQGAQDKKRWRGEKENWDKEREDAASKIKMLEEEKQARLPVSILNSEAKEMGPDKSFSTSRPQTPHPSDILAFAASSEPSMKQQDPIGVAQPPVLLEEAQSSTSLTVLRTEITRLRQSCRDMGVALHELRSEGKRINDVVQQLGSIGQRVISRTGSIRPPIEMEIEDTAGFEASSQKVE
ncbi:MAG: hypothetical protein M1827_000974 [Pycnora praestabilis]|nr:MAG: hypothetical protein M1827_000974 [Pycnora praestabilis]